MTSRRAAPPVRRRRGAPSTESIDAVETVAFDALYERYARPVMTVALSYLRDRRHAEEVVQETFVKAWRAASSLDPARDIGPWLYVIARRSALDVARRERRRPSTTHMGAVEPSDDGRGGPTLNGAWEAWQVRCALRDLRPAERKLAYLTYYQGLSQREIAQRLDWPMGTVKSRLRRIQLRLAERLAHLRA
jgi:RNA polymerase sigma-70 factor (ECF subfamily)